MPDAPDDWSTPNPTRHIRADVLRYALTRPKDAEDATEHGVAVRSAVISGELDIMDCIVHGNAALLACRFKNAMHANGTEFTKNLSLKNSYLPALSATSAKIGEQLNCEGTTFETTNRKALDLQGAEVTSGFIFRDIKAITGQIDLTAAHVGVLVDDPESRDKVTDLILDGFTYDRISGNTSATDFKTRKDWLEKGDHFDGKFFPQPYTQLAKVLQDMGHERDAREVRIALAGKLRHTFCKDRSVTPNGDVKRGLLSAWRDITNSLYWIWHMLSLLLTGHGYKPIRAAWALTILIAASWWISDKAWQAGDFAPNSAVILVSADWDKHKTSPHPAKAWEDTIAGKDWESFSPLAYAADIVIPIVDFGQTQAWSPSTNRGPWGKKLWWMRWAFTAFGWIISALGAAAITGVIWRE